MDFELLNKFIQEACTDEFISKEFFNEEMIYPRERDLLLNEAVEFVNEAFVGKTPLLQEIEDQIGVIRGKLDRYDDWDSHPEVQKLNRLFEKQFGMDIFALHMIPDNIINAYTMVIATNFDVYRRKNFASYLVADRKDGYRFKPNNDFCIVAYVYYGLLANPDITDEEIVAIILHEIGHNFADFLDNHIRLSNQYEMDSYVALKIMNIIINVLTLHLFSAGADLVELLGSTTSMNNARKSKIEKRNQKGNKRPVSSALKGAFYAVSGFFDICASVLLRSNLIVIGLSGLSRLFQKPFEDAYKDQAKRSAGRRNEIIADKFATIYGYGPELGSSLKKMSVYKTKDAEIIDKIPIFGKKINQIWEKLYLDINEFDCHPHYIQRINESIKTLEDELNQQDMDPKLKSAIMKQLREMQASIEDTKKAVNKNPDNIKIAYDAYVANELPDATYESIENEINKELNTALKECDICDKGQVIKEGSFNRVMMGFKIHPKQKLEETLKKHKYQGYLNLVNKTKDDDDLRYLRNDTWQCIRTIEKIKEIIADNGSKHKNRDNNKYVKAGITVKDCDLTVKWFKDVVLKTISEKLK
jgi:hypothetical protein